MARKTIAELVKDALSDRARKGAKARWKGTTKEERSEIARKAVQARWAKRAEEKK